MTDRRPWLAFGLILALTAILSAYYWVHKPVTPAQAMGIASVLADAAVAAWLTLLGGGLGRWLFGRWMGEHAGSGEHRGGERLAVEAALGWGAMGLGMLGLGLAALYYAGLVWAVAALASLWLWREMRGWLAEADTAFRALWSTDRLARVAALFGAGIFALSLLRALAPPLMWDALVYHLALPKLYAQTHGLRLDVDIIFSGMPQLTEMLYTAAFLLRGPMAAQTLGWAFGAVLALGLAGHAATVVGPRFAPLAPALLFASLSLALSLSWAYAETLLMLMGLALLVALRGWRLEIIQKPPEGGGSANRWLLLGGLLAGFGMGCKYTALILPLAAAVVVALTLWRLRTTPTPPRSPARPHTHTLLFPSFFLLVSLIVFSPWLLKNLLFTGSPVYPLLIPAGEMDALRQWFYNRPDLIERNPFWAALILARAVFLGVQGGNNYDATLSPLLVFLPLSLGLGWRRLEDAVRQELGPVVWFMLTAYLAWVWLTFVTPLALQARLFFAFFPALTLLGVGGLAAVAALDTPTLRPSVIVAAAVALVFGLSALEYGAEFVRKNPLAYLLGQQSAADYRAANLGWYAVAMEHVNALPDGARVLFLWEARSVDCAAPDRCAPDTVIDRWWHLRRTVGAAGDVLTRWQAQGFTHVLIYDTGVNFVRGERGNGFEDADWGELDALRAQMRWLEDIGGVYSLYALP